MKVVIIEDEIPAANKLKEMLQGISGDIHVIRHLSSVRESLAWFGKNDLPDLVFTDIESSDGLSFDLIQKARISCPIIFITAFDEYWQEAFEHNSIDYLLKPLKRERLQNALNKFNEIRDYFTGRYQNLLAYQNSDGKFRDRFLVKRGKEFASIRADEVAFFYAVHKVVCLLAKDGSKYVLDTSLTEIEKEINPKAFFRVNRRYLVHTGAIKKITALPKSRLLLEVAPSAPDELIISAENSGEFKKWMSE